MIPDLRMVLDDGFHTLDDQLANVLSGSAVTVQSVELSRYRYKEVWFSITQIADTTFSLHDIQSSHIKNLVASMRPLALDYRNSMIAEKWSAKFNPTD